MKAALSMPQDQTKYALEKVRLRDRDYEVFLFLLDCGGIAGLTQLDRLFWGGKNVRTAKNRLDQLDKEGLLARVEKGNRVFLKTNFHVTHVPEEDYAYRLTEKGAYHASTRRDADMDELFHGMPFEEWSRWNALTHDFAVNKVLIDMLQSPSDVTVRKFWPETWFRREPDEISVPNRKKPVRVLPDLVTRLHSPAPGHPGKVRDWFFLWEIDTRSMKPAKVLNKIQPGFQYLKSVQYRQRFGVRYGRWVMITEGPKRRDNLRREAAKIPGHKAWRWATF